MSSLARDAAARVMESAWEARRRLYAAGVLKPRRVAARVVSIGNLTVGGAGKTTLTLHLARRATTRGLAAHVVCRRYRPGPDGEGDEERLFRDALGAAVVHAGRVKRALAEQAARSGAALVLVDDGFSHWGLERDLDLVLLDSQDLWGGGRMLPAGRLREPRRALQRAEIVVISRLPAEGAADAAIDSVKRYAPAALVATGRHAVSGFRRVDRTACGRPERVRVVTATGNPGAVARTAEEAGCVVVSRATYRDHHWFDEAEARRELGHATHEGAKVLLTAKDAVRWPLPDSDACVMDVEWSWRSGGDEVERRVFGGGA